MTDLTKLKSLADLPENLRIPLSELQADVKYLFGRVAADGSIAGAMASSVENKLSQIETACYQLQSELAALKKAGTFNDGVAASMKAQREAWHRHAPPFNKRIEREEAMVADMLNSVHALTRPTTQPEKDES